MNILDTSKWKEHDVVSFFIHDRFKVVRGTSKILLSRITTVLESWCNSVLFNLAILYFCSLYSKSINTSKNNYKLPLLGMANKIY